MGIYISTSDVQGKAIDTRLQAAKWKDPDIETSIAEAENYIEGRLLRIGYGRSQLQSAPLIASLCVKYTRYCILRDIYTQQAPSVSPGEAYEKWKTEVNEQLDLIEANTVRLVDSNGALITPQSPDARFEIRSNTEEVARAITFGPIWTWDLDHTYYSENVVGKKPGPSGQHD